jgi:TonB family protein
MRASWILSILIHMAIFTPIVAGSYLHSKFKSKDTETFEFELLPEPTTNDIKIIPEETPQIQQRKAPPPPSTKPVEQVFGVDKSSLRSDSADALVLKEGNTIAKDVDQTKLTDQTPLPIPKPQYLVTQMPVLKSKPEIPYPPEARKREIEGKVLMNILIDENGIIRKAEIIDGPGYGLNEIAYEKIFQFVFQPAKIGDQNVPVQIRYAVTFQLRM